MAAGLRRVGRGALGVLAWPAGMAVAALLAATMISPRRVPDLARFTRSASFGQLQSAAATWAGMNFELIEGGALWLDRAGGRVLDRCETGLDSRPFRIPRDPPSVTCTRESPRVLQRSQRIRQLAAQRRYRRREHVTLRRAFLSGQIRTLQPGKPARAQEIKNRHRASAPHR